VLRACTSLGAWLVTLAVGPTAAQAAAWTFPAGHGQVIVTSLASVAERVFGSAFTPSYRKFELQALIEYGLTDRFTAIAMPSLQDVTVAPPVPARRHGIGYSELGGRYRFLAGDGWVVSGQATVRVPGTSDAGNPAAIGYTDFEFDVRALAGLSFALCGFPMFANVEAGQRVRAGAPPDEFRADLTLGLYATPRVMLLAQSFNVVSEGAGAPPFASYAYAKLQFSAVYALTAALSLQAGISVTYAGRNALQENALLFGAWYRF
jgi:hypothetical protein